MKTYFNHKNDNDKNFPKFGKRHKPKDSKNLAIPKQDNPKETHTKTYHKLLKPKDKEKNLAICKRETIPYRQGKKQFERQ